MSFGQVGCIDLKGLLVHLWMFNMIVEVRIGGVKAFTNHMFTFHYLQPTSLANNIVFPKRNFWHNTIIMCCLQYICYRPYITFHYVLVWHPVTWHIPTSASWMLHYIRHHKDWPDPALSLSPDLAVLSRAISEELLALREFMSEGYARACHIKRECLHRVIESHTFMEHQSALCE